MLFARFASLALSKRFPVDEGEDLSEFILSVGCRCFSQQKQPETASKLTQRRLMSVGKLWNRHPSPPSSHFTEFSINCLPIELRQKKVTPGTRRAHSRWSWACAPLFTSPLTSAVGGHVCQKKPAFNSGDVWRFGLDLERFLKGFPGNTTAPRGRSCSGWLVRVWQFGMVFIHLRLHCRESTPFCMCLVQHRQAIVMPWSICLLILVRSTPRSPNLICCLCTFF